MTGEANDYVGKGLSGATIVVRPTPGLANPHRQALIGNTVLYGATSGRLFAAGVAGERFAVRNSGAVAVIEGCGANGCEYMTGGTVLILGPVGFNFAAGMTGGMAFVHDPDQRLRLSLNPESVVTCAVASAHWQGVLRGLVEEHAAETGSAFAADLLRNWDLALGDFVQICPKEMVGRLDHVLEAEERVHERA